MAGAWACTVLLAILVGTAARPGAGWAAETKETVVSKEVTGDITYVGKRSISVETGRTGSASQEMLLPVSADTKFDLLRSLGELKRGDTVRVKYDQTLKEKELGKEPSLLKTIATKVTLVRRAPPPGTLQSKTGTGE